MNMAIAFYVGCVTFVLMMVIKIPIKKLIFSIVECVVDDEDRQYVIYKRWNTILFFVTMLIAAVCYCYVAVLLEVDHLKWCCSLKAGAIAIALYAVYEQWFGEK